MPKEGDSHARSAAASELFDDMWRAIVREDGSATREDARAWVIKRSLPMDTWSELAQETARRTLLVGDRWRLAD